MKWILTLLLLICLSSCKSKKSTVLSKEEEKKEIEDRFTVLKIENEEELLLKQNRAISLGKRLLESCNNSKFTPFTTNEATETVIANATRENITKTCQKINQRNGKFIDIKLLETLKDNINDEIIFRFDILYEKKLFKRELKVIVNSENKVTSITTKEISKIF
ncbi:hypothetical protein [Flavobacterium sp.]|uniref:hypothetical protein n=1 Tax=Flavobacterium sp. TaxID=239 RepID=UPI00286E533D|nr:hypothetical protein [Flavobacterium sp.]